MAELVPLLRTSDGAAQFPYFDVELSGRVAWVWLNRPAVRNAMDASFWDDLPKVVAALDADPKVRCVVVAGRGDQFSTGLDLKSFYLQHREVLHSDTGDGRTRLLAVIESMQAGMRAVHYSPKPWIAAVHGWCIGAGLDLASACDIRLCDMSAKFLLREARVGIVADMGVLSRLPAIIGYGHTRYLALTGRDIPADEALMLQLVQDVHESKEELFAEAQRLAIEIASNPFLAVQGTKQMINAVEQMGPDNAMRHVAVWNAAFLDSLDFREVVAAFIEKREPKFQ
jgi:enoyl-CoA hydratase